MTNTSIMMNVDEVAEELSISKPFAYKIMREMNSELKARGYLTIQGKVNRKYFLEKIYGGTDTAPVREAM